MPPETAQWPLLVQAVQPVGQIVSTSPEPPAHQQPHHQEKHGLYPQETPLQSRHDLGETEQTAVITSGQGNRMKTKLSTACMALTCRQHEKGDGAACQAQKS